LDASAAATPVVIVWEVMWIRIPLLLDNMIIMIKTRWYHRFIRNKLYYFLKGLLYCVVLFLWLQLLRFHRVSGRYARRSINLSFMVLSPLDDETVLIKPFFATKVSHFSSMRGERSSQWVVAQS
jgi:hypothetical protein